MSETWRPIAGYEGIYSVSEWGRVRSERRRVPNSASTFRVVRTRILKPFPDANGYLCVYLYREAAPKVFKVAFLVAQAFIGPKPEGLCILHRNGVRSQNTKGNLYYGTLVQNMQDARKHKTLREGERHYAAKLTAEQVRQIRASNETYEALAKRFGVVMQHIGSIKTRKSWKHI